MSIRSKVIASLVVLVSLTFVPHLPANAAVSCVTINKYYPNGVAASKYSKNVGNDLLATPRVKASVYKKYRHLDLDSDRIICEKEASSVPVKYSEEILNNAIADVKKRLASAESFDGDISYYISDNYPRKSAELAIEATKIGVSYFQDLYNFEGADFIFFAKEDLAWAQA